MGLCSYRSYLGLKVGTRKNPMNIWPPCLVPTVPTLINKSKRREGAQGSVGTLVFSRSESLQKRWEQWEHFCKFLKLRGISVPTWG